MADRISALEIAVRNQERRLAGMLSIATNLGRSREPRAAMRVIVSEISDLLLADRTTIYELRPGEKMLWGLAVEGEASVEVGLPLGEGVAGLVASRNRALNLKDVYKHPAFDPKYDKLTGYRTRSMLCVPMRNQKRACIGVVQVLNKCDGYFTVEDETLLTALAGQAAITLEALHLQVRLNIRNAELRGLSEELKRRVEELELLYAIACAISEAESARDLSQATLHPIAAVARVEFAAAFVPGERDRGPVYFIAAREGAKLQTIEGVEVGEGVLGKTAGRGEPFLLLPGEEAQDAVPRTLGRGCEIVVRDAITHPLTVGGETIGALALINRRAPTRRDPDEDRRLAALIGGQLAAGFANVEERQTHLQRDRLMTIGRMLSGVMHDLKGPMAIISGYGQLMATTDEPEARKEMAETIHRQVAAFNDMTREVMTFARGEQTVLKRRVYLHQFIKQALQVVEPEFAEHQVELVVEDAASTGTGFFDEAKMLRVVTNIARNARQAMGDGGRLVWRIEDGPEPGAVVFELRDNGPGIPEAIRESLFEAFTTSGKPGGTGLGLAIVRRIVEDHGGAVSVDTHTGQGTTFRIELPA